MTFSNVVISTSVKIWSISGISRAPLEAKGETITEGSGEWGVGVGNGKLMRRLGELGRTELGRKGKGAAHLRNMLEWLRRLSRADSRSGHFLRSSTRKNNAWHSFLSSASFSFNI